MKCRGVTGIILSAVLLMATASCAVKEKKTLPPAPVKSKAEVRDSLLRARADSATASLTLEQKAGMLLMPAVFTRTDDATLALIRRYAADEHTGGIILLRGDTTAARAIADTLRALGRRDMLVAIDAEWGLGMRLTDAPVYPDNGDLGGVSSPEQMRRYGADIAAQCRRLGINMVLGPVVDILPPGGNRFIGNRSFGSDPERVAALGVAYSEGVEQGGVLSVAKHFPGHGEAVMDSHKKLPVLLRSLHELEIRELVPYRRYIRAGLSGVMVGHLAVAAIDAELKSAAVSRGVISDLLRRDLHFGGLILTDALNMAGAGGASAADAVAAGADLVLAPASTTAALADILKGVSDGRLSVKEIDEHVRRIYYYIYKTVA